MKEELQKSIVDAYRIPQIASEIEGAAAQFIADLIDLTFANTQWAKLNPADKLAEVQKNLAIMEAEGFLESKVMRVKNRHFEDDENPPKLPGKVKVYKKSKGKLSTV